MPGSVAHGTYAHDLGRQHPFEVAMLLSAAAVGVSRLLAGSTSGSLERTLPPGLLLVWYVLLTFGSVVSLVGVFWVEPVTGLLVERSGLWALSSACAVFGVAIVTVGGLRGVAASLFLFGFTVACLLRAVDIGRILSRIRALGEVLNEGD